MTFSFAVDVNVGASTSESPDMDIVSEDAMIVEEQGQYGMCEGVVKVVEHSTPKRSLRKNAKKDKKVVVDDPKSTKNPIKHTSQYTYHETVDDVIVNYCEAEYFPLHHKENSFAIKTTNKMPEVIVIDSDSEKDLADDKKDRPEEKRKKKQDIWIDSDERKPTCEVKKEYIPFIRIDCHSTKGDRTVGSHNETASDKDLPTYVIKIPPIVVTQKNTESRWEADEEWVSKADWVIHKLFNQTQVRTTGSHPSIPNEVDNSEYVSGKSSDVGNKTLITDAKNIQSSRDLLSKVGPQNDGNNNNVSTINKEEEKFPEIPQPVDEGGVLSSIENEVHSAVFPTKCECEMLHLWNNICAY